MLKSRKYLRRILLSITLLMVIFLAASSFAVYYNSERNIIELQYESNKKVLSQIDYSIEFMNDTVEDLTRTIYNDYEIQKVLNSELPIGSAINVINKLNNYARSTSFLDSIYLYNGMQDRFYITRGSNFDSDMVQKEFKGYFLYPQIPEGKLIPINVYGTVNDDYRNIHFFTMFKFGPGKNSGIAVNVKPEWLFGNITNINRVADHKAPFYVLDSLGSLLNSDTELEEPSQIRRELFRHIAHSQEKIGYLQVDLGKGEKIISYLVPEIGNLTIFSVQPYTEFLGRVEGLKDTFLIFTLGSLLLAVAGSYVVSRRLYKPVENLLAQINWASGGLSGGDPQVKDELQYVSSMYGKIIDKIQHDKKDEDSKEKTLLYYWLKKLVADSQSFDLDDLRGNVYLRKNRIDLESNLLICIIKFDNYRQYLASTTTQEKNLYEFAVTNVAEEYISRLYPCAIFDITNDHLVVLLSNIEENQLENCLLLPLIKNIQDTILQYYGISITFAVSSVITDYRKISDFYEETLKSSEYRMIFGKGNLITPMMIRHNRDNLEYELPEDLQRKIIEAFKTQNSLEYEDTLNQIMDHIRSLHADMIIHSLLHILLIMKLTLNDINKNRIRQKMVDFILIQRQIMEKETLEEIRPLFIEIFNHSWQDTKHPIQELHYDLIESIRILVADRYADPNLNQQAVADTVKMSVGYIGKLFKISTGSTVVEYINQTRLEQAAKLLEREDYSVKEVMEKVGYGNESYFWRVFKKKYGTTPKEYKMTRVKARVRNTM
jgi:YesN/AraC family two-component response regulator